MEQEILQRLARLEEAVNNHIPGQLRHLTDQVRSLDLRLWGLLVLALGTLLAALLR